MDNKGESSCRILEFLLRQPIADELLSTIMLALPLPSALPFRLKKAVLLRRLASGLISRRSILTLELLHQCNVDDPDKPYARSPSLLLLLRSAYLHVAVGSTLRFLEKGDVAGFCAAAKKTWRTRVGDLLAAREEGRWLVSDKLLEWRGKMWMAASAVERAEARKRLLAGWRAKEGLAALRRYLAAEVNVMGPALLDVTAAKMIASFVAPGQGVDALDRRDGKKEIACGGAETREVGQSLRGANGGNCAVTGEEEVADGFDRSKMMACQTMERGQVSLNSKGIQKEACFVMNPVDRDKETQEIGVSSRVVDGGNCVATGEEEVSDQFDRPKKMACRSVEQGLGVLNSRGIQSEACVVMNAVNRDEEMSGRQVGNGKVGPSSKQFDCRNHILMQEGNGVEHLGTRVKKIGIRVEQEKLPASSMGTEIRTSSVPTPEVKQVKENLRRSREDLQDVVEDPLPDAKIAASRVAASRTKRTAPLSKPVGNHCLVSDHNQNQKEEGSVPLQADKEVSEVVRTRNANIRINPDTGGKKVSGCSLMDRNPTAKTYEWEDESPEFSSDNTSSPSKKLSLYSPRTSEVSPLKPVVVKKVGRKRKRWSVEEEDTLREAVKRFGVGNWKDILENYSDVFQERRKEDLKDKWRNMTK